MHVQNLCMYFPYLYAQHRFFRCVFQNDYIFKSRLTLVKNNKRKVNKQKNIKTIDAGPCSGCDGADANEDKGEEGRSEGRKKRYASELKWNRYAILINQG